MAFSGLHYFIAGDVSSFVFCNNALKIKNFLMIYHVFIDTLNKFNLTMLSDFTVK